MACPFSRLARLTSWGEEEEDDASSSSYSATKLTTRLKEGTAEAHREIEKSGGVRALMGSFHAQNKSASFSRMDHLRFLIMLASVYLTMEAVLVQDKTVLNDMMSLLIRSNALLRDIQIHLDEVLDTKDAKPSELDSVVDEGAEVYHRALTATVLTAQEVLSRQGLLGACELTSDHIVILTRRQAKAVLRYAGRVDDLRSGKRSSPAGLHHDEGISFTPLSTPSSSSPSSSSFHLPMASPQSTPAASSTWSTSDNGLILAHAYVRYMGDLSGGQHIVKRLSKLFPIYQGSTGVTSSTGFSFYCFASTKKTSMELKEMIRARMDGLPRREKDVVLIVDEASEAFRLNRGLLDSLVDEDSSEEPASADSIKLGVRTPPLVYASQLSSLLLAHPHSLTLLAVMCALASAITIRALVG